MAENTVEIPQASEAAVEVAVTAPEAAALSINLGGEPASGDALQQALGVAVAMVVCVSQEGATSIVGSTDNMEGMKGLTEQTFFCETCSQRFLRRSHLARHRLIHSGERPFVCDVCGKCFRQSSHLSSHKNTHTGARPYPCTQCDKAFASSSALGRHRHTHSDPSTKPHVCNQCGRAFRRLSHLVGHKYTHTGERPFRCTECDRAFADSSGLRRHRRRHSMEAVVQCSSSPKRAVHRVRTPRSKTKPEEAEMADVQAILAATVQQVVINEAREKGEDISMLDLSTASLDGGDNSDEEIEDDLTCASCGGEFESRSDLIKHAKTSHTVTDKPFRCSRCSKCFSKSGHLRRHIRTHTSVRPFPCDLCEKSFRQSSHLAAHKNTHTGNRPFKCPMCDRGFADSSALNKHRRRHRAAANGSADTSEVLEDSQQSYMVSGEESAAHVVVDTSDSIVPPNLVTTSDGMVTVTLAAAADDTTPLSVTALNPPLSVTDSEAAAQLLTLITNTNHMLLTSTQNTLAEGSTTASVSTVSAPSLTTFLPFMQAPTVSFVSGDSSVIVPSSGGEAALATTSSKEQTVIVPVSVPSPSGEDVTAETQTSSA